MLVSLFVGDSLGMPLSIIVYNYNNHLSENTKETKFTCIKIIQIVEVIKDKSSNFDHLLTLIGFISNLNLAIWGFRKSLKNLTENDKLYFHFWVLTSLI